MMSKLHWIDYASINMQITSKDYSGRTIQAATGLFPAGTQPFLVMTVVDDDVVEERHYHEAAQDAWEHYGSEQMPAWWEGGSKSGMRFVGGIDPETNEPFLVLPMPSEFAIRFVEPALRDLGAGMDPIAFDMLLGFFINLTEHNIVDWVLQLASGSGGQVGQTFVLTPEDIAAHGFLTRNPHLVSGSLIVGPYGTCDIDIGSFYDGFDILLTLYIKKGLVGEDEANAAMQRFADYADSHEQKFDNDAYLAMPSSKPWKDRLFPNRQHKAALSIGKKLCP